MSFTDDAPADSSDTPRRDYKTSSQPLGKLVVLSRSIEPHHGGMTYFHIAPF